GDDSGSGGDDNSGSGGGDDDDDDGDDDQSSSGASDRDGRDRFVADELVVINQDAAFFERVRNLGFAVVDQRPLGALGFTVTRLRVPATLQPGAARALLRRTFPDLLTDVNAVYRPQQAQVSLPAPDYARRLVGWGDVPGDCGRGVPVGLVDTGIDGALAAFAGRDIVRRSFLDAGAVPAPVGHGTAIAGLLIGGGNDAATAGLLPAAKLHLAEAFEQDADGNPAASVVGVAAALDWLVEAKVPVINLSLSGDDNLLMRIAVTRAAQRGAILVAAAGNNGPGGGPAYPGAYDEVLAVTAVDHRSQPYERANQGDYIDFAAPGVRVWAPAAGGGTYHTGSSFAAPFVTAAVA
ncbi:MAG: S8 family serine peptidase, partial [Dongiaceae bacterium]